MSPAKQLYDLQQIDLDIERLTDALQQTQAQLSDTTEVSQAKAALEQERKELQALQKKQHDAEWEIDDLRAKADQMRKKLYGGSVKNPKELMSLQQEFDLLSKRITEKEDTALDIMGEKEDLQGRVDQSAEKLQGLEKRWSEKQKILLDKKQELDQQLASSELQRQTLTVALNASELDLYGYLRSGRRRPAIAKVEQGRCQGCRITLPMNKIQQLRTKRDIVQCDSCERILFLE